MIDDKKNSDQDDIQDVEADIIDDDFDFDDIDDIDEIEDVEDAEIADDDFAADDGADDWDDFDDEDTSGGAKGPSDKTFIQKYFNVIVVGVAVVLGLGFLLMQFSGSPQKPKPRPAPQPAAETAQFQPPVEENITDTSQQDIANPLNIEAEPITLEMEDDVMEEEDAAADQPVQEETVNTEPGVLTPMPSDLFAAEETAPTQEEVEVAQVENLFEEPEAETETNAVEEEPVNLDAMPEPAQSAQSENVSIEPINAELQHKTEENSALKTQLKEQEEEIKSLRQAASKHSKILQDKDTHIKRLETQLQIAENKLKNKPKTQKSAPTPLIEESGASAAPAVNTPKNRDATASRVSKTPATWVLRSAQPGTAMIAQKGNNNLRSVQVGDHISGLGRIQSIALENGLWVVRGSAGTVSQ